MPDFWFIVPEGAVVRSARAWKDADGIGHPASAFYLWTAAELRAQGVYPGRYEPAPPVGRYQVASESVPAIVGNEAIITRTHNVLPEPVPSAVTRLQLIRALRELGRKAEFDAAMAAAPAETQEDWNLASVVTRTSPLVSAFAASLGTTGSDLDHIFRLATTK